MIADFKTPSLARRMACWLYEGVLMFGVVFMAGYLFGTLTQTRNPADNRHALQAFIFVVAGVYFVWFWAKGQTLAMKTWQITVMDLDGRPLSQQRALLRYLLCWLWFVPALAVQAPFQLSVPAATLVVLGWVVVWAMLSLLHPRRQFWHDALARTQLVSTPPLKS